MKSYGYADFIAKLAKLSHVSSEETRNISLKFRSFLKFLLKISLGKLFFLNFIQSLPKFFYLCAQRLLKMLKIYQILLRFFQLYLDLFFQNLFFKNQGNVHSTSIFTVLFFRLFDCAQSFFNKYLAYLQEIVFS